MFHQNPFKFDIAGKTIKFGESDKKEGQLQICDELELVPDFSTLRTAPWLKNEAYVISDLRNPENG